MIIALLCASNYAKNYATIKQFNVHVVLTQYSKVAQQRWQLGSQWVSHKVVGNIDVITTAKVV